MVKSIVVKKVESAFKNCIKTYAYENVGYTDMREFLKDVFPYFNESIADIFNRNYLVKVHACLTLQMVKDPNMESEVYLRTKVKVLQMCDYNKEWYDVNVHEALIAAFDNLEQHGSGWRLNEIIEVRVFFIDRFECHGGSSYLETPKKLATKKAIVNVRNDDEHCFQWAVLSALYPAANSKSAPLIKTYEEEKQNEDIVWDGLTYPTPLKDLKIFEKNNPNISIYVYMYSAKSDRIFPIRLCEKVKQNHIYLLYLSEYDNDNKNESEDDHVDLRRVPVKSHYVLWIKNLSRLISSQVTEGKRKLFFCDRCFQHMISQENLVVHKQRCLEQNECVIDMPQEEEKMLRFKSFHKELKVPFIVYADTEAMLTEPMQSFSNSDNTKAFQKHELYSVGMYFHSHYDHSRSFYNSNRSCNASALR